MNENRVSGRRVFDTRNTPFRPYDRYGKAIDRLSWVPFSVDEESGRGCFLIRFAPGGQSLPHVHTGGEDFLMLEGELVDDDGTVFRAGDFVSYAPGTRHSSTSPGGCLAVVFLGGHNRLVDDASGAQAEPT